MSDLVTSPDPIGPERKDGLLGTELAEPDPKAAGPRVWLLALAAGVTVASVAARAGWSRISAVRYHHVYPFNDDLASRPGPRIVLGLETLARLLHPGLFG